MSHGRAAGALAVSLCLTWLAPTTAAALEPGVYITPGSPAAKEYGVPLWVLRGEASGHQSPQGVPQPPRFGVGIGPAPASSRGAGRAGAAGTLAGGARGAPPGASAHPGASAPGRPGAVAPSASAAGLPPVAIARLTRHGSPAPLVALLAAGVLASGLAVGAVLAMGRRRAAG